MSSNLDESLLQIPSSNIDLLSGEKTKKIVASEEEDLENDEMPENDVSGDTISEYHTLTSTFETIIEESIVDNNCCNEIIRAKYDANEFVDDEEIPSSSDTNFDTEYKAIQNENDIIDEEIASSSDRQSNIGGQRINMKSNIAENDDKMGTTEFENLILSKGGKGKEEDFYLIEPQKDKSDKFLIHVQVSVFTFAAIIGIVFVALFYIPNQPPNFEPVMPEPPTIKKTKTPMNLYKPNDPCNISNESFPHITAQCNCSGFISIIPSDLTAVYSQIVSELIGTVFDIWDHDIQDCDPSNQALLFLASNGNNFENSESNEMMNIGNLTQRFAISQFYYQLDGPKWRSQELWISNNNECSWSGIDCNADNMIIKIDLKDNNAAGTIPSNLALLTRLEILSIAQNKLLGTIPTEIFVIQSLMNLDLNSNQLEGQIPSEIGMASSLQAFRVDDNILDGTIPTEIFSIPNLQDVRISVNKLDGPLPTEVGSIASVKTISVFLANGNNLDGAIPTELGRATLLRDLNLANNNFSATDNFPTEINQLTRLVSLNLEMNEHISARLPTEIGLFTDLRFLSISNTNFRSRLPRYYESLTNLRELHIANTKVGGYILPSVIESLTNLEHINFSGSRFRQSIPSELGILTKLTHLLLSRNTLDQNIPTEIGLLTRLATLALQNNWLIGEIPSELGQLKQLETLSLEQNFLTGRPPKALCQMRTLSRLQIFTTDCPTRAFGIICPIPMCCTSCSSAIKT